MDQKSLEESLRQQQEEDAIKDAQEEAEGNTQQLSYTFNIIPELLHVSLSSQDIFIYPTVVYRMFPTVQCHVI